MATMSAGRSTMNSVPSPGRQRLARGGCPGLLPGLCLPPGPPGPPGPGGMSISGPINPQEGTTP
jgi:hypothetical protein